VRSFGSSSIDLDKRGMDRKILELAGAPPGADACVFHYSGHGLRVAGVNYLVPVDAELASAAALDLEAVRLDLVQRTMEREAKTNILFLDACRNNPLAGAGELRWQLRIRRRRQEGRIPQDCYADTYKDAPKDGSAKSTLIVLAAFFAAALGLAIPGICARRGIAGTALQTARTMWASGWRGPSCSCPFTALPKTDGTS
jgi:hypothetical protein